MNTNDKRKLLLIFGIIFVAFNLRPAITSVGPLVGYIRADTGVTNGMAGLLTTLPLLAFAFISPFTPKFAHRYGHALSILIGLSLLGAGIVIRSTGPLPLLYTGTIFIGLGIAVCNVLLPGIVRQNFPGKVGLFTGIYTLSMAVWAGIAPGLSVPLVETFGSGWRLSLGVWVLLLLLAMVIWLPQLKNNQKTGISPNRKQTKSSLWTSPIAWQVTFFMGLQSMVYFSLTAWLPEILHSHGLTIATAGWMLSVMQFSGLPANFLVPVLADRLPNQKGIALGIGSFCLTGLIGLLYGGHIIVITFSIVLIGIALGAAISHALTLISLRAVNSTQASDLSGMAQSVGYILASIGPFMIGYLYDLYSNWTSPLIVLAFVSILFTIAGVGAGRNQYVFQEVKDEVPSNSTI